MKPLRWLTVALGVLVSALIVWLIARDVDAARLTRVLAAADGSWITLGVIAIITTMITRVRRWAVLLRPIVLPPSTLLRALLIGQVLNFVLPLRLGDVARSAIVGRAPHTSFERVLGSVAIEKAWDWLTLALMAIVAALSVPVPAWYSAPLQSIGLIAAIVLIGFGAIALAPAGRWRPRLDRIINRLKFADRVRRLFDSLVALRTRRIVSQAAAWSLLAWGLGVVANYGVLRAYGIDAWGGALVLMVVLMVGVAVPPSIAAIGVFEGLTILTLRTFSVSDDIGLAVGLTLHVVAFAPLVVGAAGLMALENRMTKRKPPLNRAEVVQRELNWHEHEARRRIPLDKLLYDPPAFDAVVQAGLDFLQPQAGELILELGCGEGKEVLTLARLGLRVIGIDLARAQLLRARDWVEQAAPHRPLALVQASAERLPFAAGSFRIIYGKAILHHLDLSAAAQETHRVLQNGGRATFAEPLAHHPLFWLGRRLTPGLHTQDERPCPLSAYAEFAGRFERRTTEAAFLFAPIAYLFRKLPNGEAGFRRAHATLQRFDHWLFAHLPVLKRFAWYGIILIDKRNRE